MWEKELIKFIILASIILLIFIWGIIVFIFKYQKRKLVNEQEKNLLTEQHTQELLISKLEMQQQTMQDIGREIHDNVGQLLTVASIHASQMAYENQYPPQNEKITTVWKIIDQSLEELRSLSKDLTNEKAEMAELIDLVQNECVRINALNICKVTCTYNELSFTISNAIKNFILRIIQEFIQNSLKHAACKNILLDLNYTVTGLTLHIRDDGKGFDIKAVSNDDTRGIGLSNMEKRAALIGAGFSFHSVPGHGTALDILIPANKLNFT